MPAAPAVAAVDAVTKGASKNKGLLAKLATRLKDALKRLWDNPKVTKMLTKLGTTLGKTNVGKWLLGIKESIEKVFKEGFLAVPYLMDQDHKYPKATMWKTAIKNGGICVVDDEGKIISTEDRYHYIIDHME